MPTPQKTYKEPVKGEIEDFFDIQKLDAEQRANIKVQTLTLEKPTRAFTKNGMSINILNVEEDNNRLKVECEVTQDGKITPYVGADCLYFVNPPIKVPDGTYRKEVSDITGEEYDVENTVEDPAKALKEIIADTLRIIRN